MDKFGSAMLPEPARAQLRSWSDKIAKEINTAVLRWLRIIASVLVTLIATAVLLAVI